MGQAGIFEPNPEYGPGNEDYEYDRARQREDDARPMILPGMSFADYLADPAPVPSLSSSIAHLIANRSALHAWHAHPRLNQNHRSEEAGEFDYGTAAHAMLLEGSEAGLLIVEADDWRKKEARELREKARAEGKTPLLSRQVKRVRTMVEAARSSIEASELAGIFSDGKPEQTIIWQEGPSYCRMRADWLTEDRQLILDYKTASSAHPEAFLRQAIGYGYAMQEAFYRRGVKAATGRTPGFVFLVQEKEPPFACSLISFDPAMQEMGDRQVEYALSLWRTSMKTGKWPGYSPRIAYLEPPAWYAARAESIDFDNLDEAMNP